MNGIEVRFFGPLRDIVRCSEVVIDVPAPATGATAFDVLAVRYPELRPWKQSVRLAVNRRYVPFESAIASGDEISFIPPVSGG